MNNFSINTNFNIPNFNADFNPKNDALEGGVSFDEVFNSIGQNQKQAPTSEIAKMANDIGSGLSNSINQLNAVDKQAETDFETFASGGDISVHEVMISAQKSQLAMQMAIQLRNQMLSAYNEFKNMQV